MTNGQRNLNIISAVILLFLFTASCSSKKNSKTGQDIGSVTKTSIDSLQLVISPDETEIASTGIIEVLPNGDLVVLDTDQNKVLLFHPNGILYNKFGQRGKGPGEFIAPRILTVENAKIEVLDLGLQRVNQYSLDGSFIKNYDIQRETSYFGFVALGDSTEYYTVANGQNGKLIGHHNAATDSIRYFGEAVVKNPPPVNDRKAFKESISNGNPPKAISNDLVMDYKDGNLYVFLKAHSRLQKYQEGEPLWDIKINHPANEKIFDDFTENVLSGSSAFGILRYIDGMKTTQENIYILWNGNPQTIVQVSTNGNIRHVYELPTSKKRRFSALAVDTDTNRLYLGDDARVFVFSLD